MKKASNIYSQLLNGELSADEFRVQSNLKFIRDLEQWGNARYSPAASRLGRLWQWVWYGAA